MSHYRKKTLTQKKKKKKKDNFIPFEDANVEFETRYRKTGKEVTYLVHTSPEKFKFYHTLYRSRKVTDEYYCSVGKKKCKAKVKVQKNSGKHQSVFIEGSHNESCRSFVPKTSLQKPKKKFPFPLQLDTQHQWTDSFVIRTMPQPLDLRTEFPTSINTSNTDFPQQSLQNEQSGLDNLSPSHLEEYYENELFKNPFENSEEYENFLNALIVPVENDKEYNNNYDVNETLSVPENTNFQQKNSNATYFQKGYTSEINRIGLKRPRVSGDGGGLKGCRIEVKSVKPNEIYCGFGFDIAIHITFISNRSLSIMSLIPPDQIQKRVFVLFGNIHAKIVYNISPSGERNTIKVEALTKEFKNSGVYDVTVRIPPAVEGVKRNGLCVKEKSKIKEKSNNEDEKDNEDEESDDNQLDEDNFLLKKGDKGFGSDDDNCNIFDGNYSDKSFFEGLLDNWFEEKNSNQKKFDFSKINQKKRMQVFQMYKNAKDYRGYDIGIHFIGKNLTGPLSKLLESELCNINHTDNFGNSYLHWAHYYGNEKAIKLLKKYKAIENGKNCFGILPHEFTKKNVARLKKTKNKMEIFYEDVFYLRKLFKHREFTLTSFKKSGELVAVKFNVPQEKGDTLPFHVMFFDCRYKIHEVILKDVPSSVLEEVKNQGVIFSVRLFNTDKKSGRLKEIKMVSSEAFRPKQEGWKKKNPEIFVEKFQNKKEWLKVRFIFNSEEVAKRINYWVMFYVNVELFTESNKKIPFVSFGFPFIKRSQSLGYYGTQTEKGKEFIFFNNKNNGDPEMKAYIEHVTEENGVRKNEKVEYKKEKGKKIKVRAKGYDIKTVEIYFLREKKRMSFCDVVIFTN